ncbi:FAD-dependent thymidylate synthase [compost metagenome]
MVLPQSMMVDWIWTGNLLSMFHIYRLRSGEGAQVEAKDFAEKLQDVVQPLFPHCWSSLKNEPQTYLDSRPL